MLHDSVFRQNYRGSHGLAISARGLVSGTESGVGGWGRWGCAVAGIELREPATCGCRRIWGCILASVHCYAGRVTVTAMLAMIFVYVVVFFIVQGRRQAERQGSIDVVHAAMRVSV